MTYREVLRELAYDSHGVVTTRAAAGAGVPAVELRKLASRGALERIGYGVYRMLETPHNDLREYAEAVALAGPDAVLADEAVLAAHRLAQVNLRRIKVAVPGRVKAQVPATVELLHRQVAEADRDYIDGIPAMTVAAALRGSRNRVLPERLVDAAHEAARRGLISHRDEQTLIAELGET